MVRPSHNSRFSNVPQVAVHVLDDTTNALNHDASTHLHRRQLVHHPTFRKTSRVCPSIFKRRTLKTHNFPDPLVRASSATTGTDRRSGRCCALVRPVSLKDGLRMHTSSPDPLAMKRRKIATLRELSPDDDSGPSAPHQETISVSRFQELGDKRIGRSNAQVDCPRCTTHCMQW